MTNPEYECTILDADIAVFKSKLESLKAKNKGESFQKRYVYDFEPINPNSWIRLRTNGNRTTLAIKDIKDKNSMGGTLKSEIEVDSFLGTKEILKRLGYKPRNYQENKREVYEFGNVSIKIDYWPMIPAYIKIEGSSESDVLDAIKVLGLNKLKITTLDVQSIYKEIYGIDLLNIRELRF